MSAVFDTKLRKGEVVWLDWLPVIAGLLVVYVPAFYGFANGIWQQDD